MKIAMIQRNYTVGDIDGNTRKIIEGIRQAAQAGAELAVFSELAVTGYYPMDLLEEPGFIEAQDAAVERIAAATRGLPLAVALGMATRNPGPGKRFYNSLAVFRNGERVAVHHKQLLPTYNIFDEARHFEPGKGATVWEFDGRRIGLMVCEDGWNDDLSLYGANPWEDLMAEPLDCVVSVNASPSDLGKPQAREALFSGLAAKYRVPLVYVNQVGGNDSLVFDGHSFACDGAGKVVARLKGFEEDSALLSLPEGGGAALAPFPACAEEFMFRQIVLGIRDYLAKTGMKSVVVGSSGGIDSALVLALAAEAMGPDNVRAVTMPGPYSSVGSVDDSVALCAALGVRLDSFPIKEGFHWAVAGFAQAFGEAPGGLAQENLQARLRGVALMAYSNHSGALVLSTGNKSEMSVGYATLYGDMNGGLNPVGDLYKTEIYALARWYNAMRGKAVIPQAIIDKAPSAELAPGQQDSDSLPPYPVLDEVLKLLIEGPRLAAAEYAHAKAFVAGLDAELVQRVRRLVTRSEFKRRQAPPIIRVRVRAFGSGRQMPVAARY